MTWPCYWDMRLALFLLLLSLFVCARTACVCEFRTENVYACTCILAINNASIDVPTPWRAYLRMYYTRECVHTHMHRCKHPCHTLLYLGQ